jgi:hypothetical protein
MILHRRSEEYWRQGPESAQLTEQRLKALGGSFAAFSVGEGHDDEPLASLLYMPPGFVLPRHAHACHRVEIIIHGSLETPEGIATSGDVMMSPPLVPYGPHIAGPDGALTAEIFARADGLPSVYEQDPDAVSAAAIARIRQAYDAAGVPPRQPAS